MTKTKSKSSSKTARKGLAHHVKKHAKRAWHATPKFIHGMVAGAFVGVVIVASFGISQRASALNITSPRDCDSYAVINCGALSTEELQKHYSDAGVATIYKYFGITSTDISTIGTTAVAGTVYDDGTVTVGKRVVATNAITAARKYITGSTTVTVGGVTFYVRPVKVSFARQSVPSYVVMKDNKFQYAILASCGNPITATPTAPPATPPTPPPTHPPVTPPVTPPITPPSTTTPTPPPPVETPPETLPNTGPGAVIIIAALTIAGGYIFHMRHRHVQRKKAAHHPTRRHTVHHRTHAHPKS